jgi:hypothetical protein
MCPLQGQQVSATVIHKNKNKNMQCKLWESISPEERSNIEETIDMYFLQEVQFQFIFKKVISGIVNKKF